MKYSRTQWWLPKLLCLIAACAFWVYVMNEQNPVMENTYTIPVEVRNLDRSLVATNVPSKVRVKIRMSRSDMISLRTDDIKAYVDLSGVTDGDHPNTRSMFPFRAMKQSSPYPRQFFNLNVDTYAVKSLPATVEIFGNPDPNFTVGDNKVTPGSIMIAGSSSKISEANRAVVSVNIAGKDKNFTEFDSVNILDADGNTVTGLEIMPSQVKVSVNVKENQKVGNLQVKASTKVEVAKGYRITDVIVTPPVATVTAPISYFDKNKAIELDPIDVTGASKDVVQTVNVPAPLGGSVAVPQVTVTIKIEKD